MIELVDKDVKTVIITIFHMFKRRTKIKHAKQRHGKYKKDSGSPPGLGRSSH